MRTYFQHFFAVIIGIVSALFIAACSSQIPPEIRQPLSHSLTINQIQAEPETYISKPVRWGGVILSTDNKKEGSWISIVAYPLSNNGKPLTLKNSTGRFIARFDSFIEPQVYSRDRVITILGKFVHNETIKVGEFIYNYPLIEVQKHFLWPVERFIDELYPPWRYEPYYRPYIPHHRH